jgi:DNA-binding CsgD family transcriptional regulator
LEGRKRLAAVSPPLGSVDVIEPSADRVLQDWPEWAAHWFMGDRTARIIVTRDLQLLAVNKRASEILAASGLLSIWDGQLLATRNSADLREAVAGASAVESTHLLGEADEGVLLTVGAASDGPDEPVALTLHEISVPVEIDASDLCQAFGLTPCEEGVVLGLLRGQSSREIADETGRSILTVRTHFKRAYEKIGVRTQAQLFVRLRSYTSTRAGVRPSSADAPPRSIRGRARAPGP